MIFRRIVAGGLVLIALACCENKEERNLETVSGEPLSVQVTGGAYGHHCLSLLIKTENGVPLLCYSTDYPTLNLTNAAVLIDAEIKDGDSESIEIRGYRQGSGRFMMKSVSAMGYDQFVGNTIEAQRGLK